MIHTYLASVICHFPAIGLDLAVIPSGHGILMSMTNPMIYTCNSTFLNFKKIIASDFANTILSKYTSMEILHQERNLMGYGEFQ